MKLMIKMEFWGQYFLILNPNSSSPLLQHKRSYSLRISKKYLLRIWNEILHNTNLWSKPSISEKKSLSDALL